MDVFRVWKGTVVFPVNLEHQDRLACVEDHAVILDNRGQKEFQVNKFWLLLILYISFYNFVQCYKRIILQKVDFLLENIFQIIGCACVIQGDQKVFGLFYVKYFYVKLHMHKYKHK